jgi:hypothetical protein
MANKLSRWETTKNNSTWHFDNTKMPVPGADSYTYVGNFAADYSQVIADYTPRTKGDNWSNYVIRPSVIKDNTPGSVISAEQADLIRAGADKDGETYNRVDAIGNPLFAQIANALGMEMNMIKYHNQRTGQYAVTHIDDYFPPTLSRWRWLQRHCEIDPVDPDRDITIRRFAVMLADWQLGQVFQVGNATWSNWRAGDCITWDWYNIPHATANIGWWDRPMLQLTGAETEVTRSIVTDANLGKYLHVDITFSS